jgi:hypothetical protein
VVDGQFTGRSGWGISMSRSGEFYVSAVTWSRLARFAPLLDPDGDHHVRGRLVK